MGIPEMYPISFIRHSLLLPRYCINCRGETYGGQRTQWHVLQPRGGKTLAWLLAGSSIRIGSYFWKGVCVWIGRLVGSAEIFPTAATVKR